VHKRPWTFHLGAKLVLPLEYLRPTPHPHPDPNPNQVLPLEYLRRCAPPNDTLIVFTDHDVVFQVR